MAALVKLIKNAWLFLKRNIKKNSVGPISSIPHDGNFGSELRMYHTNCRMCDDLLFLQMLGCYVVIESV